MWKFKTLSDQNLLKQLNHAVENERESQATLLEYLAEVDRRSLYAVLGYSSLWRFAVEELKLSEDSAIKRIQAARLGAKYTCIVPLLRKGKLTLSVLYRLYPYLRDHNLGWLIEQCQGKSVRQVRAFLAKHFPKEGTPDEMTQLSSDQTRISFTADVEFRQKLEELKARLRHRYPKGQLRDLFFAAMSALEKDLDAERKPKRIGAPRPQKAMPSKPTRYLLKQTREVVWHRDGGSCSYVSERGKRCGEKSFLEYDHRVAWARGGSNHSDNIRLLCRTHNRLMAERAFGVDFIRRKIEAGKKKLPEPLLVEDGLKLKINKCPSWSV